MKHKKRIKKYDPDQPSFVHIEPTKSFPEGCFERFLVETFKSINLDDHLELDLGIDSLNRIELLAFLEKLLNCKIPEATLSKITTVRELIAETINLQQQTGTTTKVISSTTSLWSNILVTLII